MIKTSVSPAASATATIDPALVGRKVELVPDPSDPHRGAAGRRRQPMGGAFCIISGAIHNRRPNSETPTALPKPEAARITAREQIPGDPRT